MRGCMEIPRLRIESRFACYLTAILLAAAGQLATVPFVSANMTLIGYAPFIVLSAVIGGLGPGLLTTVLCTLEALYFVIEPAGSFSVADLKDLERVGGLLLTGAIASVFSEKLKRSVTQLAEAHRQTTTVLESIRDGFNVFDRQWRYI